VTSLSLASSMLSRASSTRPSVGLGSLWILQDTHPVAVGHFVVFSFSLSALHGGCRAAIDAESRAGHCCADPDAEVHAMLLDIVIVKQAVVVTTAELAGVLYA
jgi:hypothetical protein